MFYNGFVLLYIYYFMFLFIFFLRARWGVVGLLLLFCDGFGVFGVFCLFVFCLCFFGFCLWGFWGVGFLCLNMLYKNRNGRLQNKPKNTEWFCFN